MAGVLPVTPLTFRQRLTATPFDSPHGPLRYTHLLLEMNTNQAFKPLSGALRPSTPRFADAYAK
jgi:hypothetical protein